MDAKTDDSMGFIQELVWNYRDGKRIRDDAYGPRQLGCRFVPKLSKDPIAHPAFMRAESQIALLHLNWREIRDVSAMLLMGQSGVGKTYLLEHYAKRIAPIQRADRMTRPVLYIRVPSRPSGLDLAERMLAALGFPIIKNKERRQTDALVAKLDKFEVELIFIDELQHALEDREWDIKTFGNWMKDFCDNSGRPVVCATQPSGARIILENVQLRRRFERFCTLEPFEMEPTERWDEYLNVLYTIHTRMPLPAPDFSEPELAMRFYFASGSCIDFIIKIANASLAIAARQGSSIDLEVLAEACEEVIWKKKVPKSLNPFLCDISELRHLRAPGEPYAKWDEFQI